MKKLRFLLFVIPFFFVSCSSDNNEETEDLLKDQIYATFQVTHMDSGSGYVDVSGSTDRTELMFNPDGTYFSNGYFGSKTGTYTVSGKTAKCYIGKELHLTCEFLSLTSSLIEIKVTYNKTTVKIKCSKALG